jgi:hypothetical protein
MNVLYRISTRNAYISMCIHAHICVCGQIPYSIHARIMCGGTYIENKPTYLYAYMHTYVYVGSIHECIMCGGPCSENKYAYMHTYVYVGSIHARIMCGGPCSKNKPTYVYTHIYKHIHMFMYRIVYTQALFSIHTYPPLHTRIHALYICTYHIVYMHVLCVYVPHIRIYIVHIYVPCSIYARIECCLCRPRPYIQARQASHHLLEDIPHLYVCMHVCMYVLLKDL